MAMVYDGGGGPVPSPVPLGGGGIHWFGPGGSGVAYPTPRPIDPGPIFGGQPVHLPIQVLGGRPIHLPIQFPGGFRGGPPFHGVPGPGIHPAIAHAAARRAAVRALNLRRRLF